MDGSRRYCLWLKVPGAPGWSCIARDLSAGQAREMADAMVHPVRVDEQRED